MYIYFENLCKHFLCLNVLANFTILPYTQPYIKVMCVCSFKFRIHCINFFLNLGTVNGPLIPEMTILEAYQKLRLAVYATKFMVQVEFDNQEVYYFLTEHGYELNTFI